MADQHDIDALRERLRSLGYLDAPVDRYVLGADAGRAGSARLAIGAGLRVGAVAGVLLGVSAAIVLAARAPGFITSTRDAIVLALALTIVFTIASAAMTAIVVHAASWYARRSATITPARARTAAAAGGIVTAIACAAYFTLWWNAAQSLFSGLTFGWNAAALALGVAVALLLAHAVSVVILAALARSERAGDIRAGGILSSRAFLAAFGVVLFAGSSVLLASRATGSDAHRDAPSITVTPTGYALRVVAIDGFDPQAVDSARLPVLARLMQAGGLELARDAASPDPARDWTTIATAQPPEVHGISSLESRRAVGIEGRLPATATGAMRSLLNAADLLRLTTPSVTSGIERRSPAFWEVAAAAGLRTAVVNWWATWPAQDDGNIAITDRALLRLDTGGTLDAEIAPASLYEPLRARWPEARRVAEERAASEFASIADPELRKVMVRSAEIDLLVTALSRVNAGGPLDLLVIYLPGLDIAQHNLLQTSSTASVVAMRDRVAAIEQYYRFLDSLLGERLTPAPSTIDAVILWPGRTSTHAGRLALAGPPIQSGLKRCDDCAGGLGVAPALLYLLGLPISDQLRGGAAAQVATEDFASRHPVRRIASYDAIAARRAPQRGQPLDAEALERLRSLGYIR